MTGIVAHTYPEWWLKLTGQVAHWSTDYSALSKNEEACNLLLSNVLPEYVDDEGKPTASVFGRDVTEAHEKADTKAQLEMARIEKGTLEVDEIAWSAEQFNDTLYSVFHEMMVQKNIEFTRQIDINNHYVFCDPIKLREIFLNILSNTI